jgi:hypothetical protein
MPPALPQRALQKYNPCDALRPHRCLRSSYAVPTRDALLHAPDVPERIADVLQVETTPRSRSPDCSPPVPKEMAVGPSPVSVVRAAQRFTLLCLGIGGARRCSSRQRNPTRHTNCAARPFYLSALLPQAGVTSQRMGNYLAGSRRSNSVFRYKPSFTLRPSD